VARLRLDAPSRDERRRVVEAARLRMVGLARRYRHLKVEARLGRKPTPDELAADAAWRDGLLCQADELDPAGAHDTWGDAHLIVQQWNLSRPDGEAPI
jgi:hypothetical protein